AFLQRATRPPSATDTLSRIPLLQPPTKNACANGGANGDAHGAADGGRNGRVGGAADCVRGPGAMVDVAAAAAADFGVEMDTIVERSLSGASGAGGDPAAAGGGDTAVCP
ncbi:hypothetical protein MNEG_8052, partial [Monoraphidium neglectum]